MQRPPRSLRSVVSLCGSVLCSGIALPLLAAEPGPFCIVLPDQKVLPGQEDVWFPVLFTNEEPLQAFQLMGVHDPALLTLDGVETRFTSLPGDPEVFVVNEFEGRFEIGIVFDFEAPFTGTTFPAGGARRALNLIFDVSATAPPGTVTSVDLVNDQALSPIMNIFTVDGESILPCLKGSTVTIVGGNPPLFVRGDANSDGQIDLSDAVRTLNFLFVGGERPPCLDAADFSDRGEVDISSAVATLNFLFLGGPEPAVPFPNSGLDPTEDGLPCP